MIQELRAEKNIRVTAYMTAHLNVAGDIYKQNESESLWLINEFGETVIQDYGQFNVCEINISYSIINELLYIIKYTSYFYYHQIIQNSLIL